MYKHRRKFHRQRYPSWDDGRKCPVTVPDAVSALKSDANTMEYVFKKGGKEAWSGRAG